MYAILETGGKQVKVEEGSVIFVEKLQGEVGEKVTFDKVLLVNGEKVQVGKPYVKGAKVSAVIEAQARAKKIIVFKYRPKKNERKKQGHRQSFTKLKIEKISC